MDWILGGGDRIFVRRGRARAIVMMRCDDFSM